MEKTPLEKVRLWHEQPQRTVGLLVNEPLRVRPGLVYSVLGGVIRLQSATSFRTLGFVNSFFEVPCDVHAYAQSECLISWRYWTDLALEEEVLVRASICREYTYLLEYSSALEGSSTEVLLQFLLFLGKRFGTNVDGYYEIPWLITQEVVSKSINMVRVTVTRAFKKAKKNESLIITDSGRIRIREKLAE